MTNQTLTFKLEERLNKISSLDYGNLQPSQIAEVINKAQDQWVRRQLEGINQTKTGNEGSIRRIDDLQYILVSTPLPVTNKGLYWESTLFPPDYIEWCRISAKAQDECKNCCPRSLVIFLGNEADVDLYLADENRKPDYNWATTFATVMDKTFKVWTNGTFDVVESELIYYRRPRLIIFAGGTNPYDGTVSPVDIECEFPDAICELIIDEAASILSGDMDSWNQQQRLTQSAEINN